MTGVSGPHFPVSGNRAGAEGPRFTLEEARRELARQRCATYGHSYDVETCIAGYPVAITCSDCGGSWVVEAP